MIADEIKADVNIARRGALLHDVGKSIDHDVEGTHALIGGDLARRFKLPEPIAHCIEAHHDEVELQSVEAIIVQIADAISGGRPGARRESVDRYIERLRSLEEIATSFAGVGQPSQSRPAARSASSSTRRRSTTSARCGWRATSASRSKRTCSTPARFA